MFHFLFQEIHKPIILVLNPLDSLGNNQVNPIIFLLDYWLATMQRQADIVVTRHKQK
ncbi:hypothetical protein VP01_675g9 [Puccinia sorghi]|uniref:Uncharacterized protein n=1 Tax=Puccinia sorghi TaxID=27349 RepID=A0A0L6UER9_9BASI|nr:hypothetical protein VP01_675g9 [Puccinia sorghi]